MNLEMIELYMLLSLAWKALRRQGWEDGPTANEVDEMIHNYCQRQGMDDNDEPLMSLWKTKEEFEIRNGRRL